MSWPEDPHAREELPGQILHEAFDLLSQRKVDEDEGNPTFLTPTIAASFAKSIAEQIMSSELTELEGDKLAGVTYYDTRKVSKCVLEAVDALWNQKKESGELVTSDNDQCCRYETDIFTSRGRRATMEDRHIAIQDLNALLGLEDFPPQAWFGVYDGHGGSEAAKFVQAHLHYIVGHQSKFKDDPVQALIDGFLETDKLFLEKSNRDVRQYLLRKIHHRQALSCGATAVACLIRGRKLYVAWLGDSQAALCRGDSMVAIMDPHKPEREDEKQRITDNKGVVVWFGAWRVNGVLSVSRAIGDAKLKQWVIGRPDVTEHDITDDCEYLILACDGMWDVMDNEKVMAFIKEWKETQEAVTGVAKALVEHCIDNLASTDNISIIIVFLHDHTADAWTAAAN